MTSLIPLKALMENLVILKNMLSHLQMVKPTKHKRFLNIGREIVLRSVI